MKDQEIEFDSDEEMYFSWWLEELKELGYINKIEYQPEAFSLSSSIWVDYIEHMKTKDKYVTEEVLKGHIYTCDFYVEWNSDFDKSNKVSTSLTSGIRKKKSASLQFILSQLNPDKPKSFSYIEVKPSYDMNNMTRLAKINQKWVWEKHGIFVNIVIPEKHFNKTFTPERFRTTNKSGKPRKIKYKNLINAQEFLEWPQIQNSQKVLF